MYKYILTDFKRIFYLKYFKRLPYKDFFFYKTSFRFVYTFINYRFYIYTGYKWFKVIINSWRIGFSIKLFSWCKKIAIFKKKMYLKKKK
jgi:hypothetical protein